MNEGYWITTEQHERCEEERERLRAECLRLNHAEAEAMSVVLSQEGQIERLRAELAAVKALLREALEAIEFLEVDARLCDRIRATLGDDPTS